MPGGPTRFIALCSTGALEVDFPPEKAGPMRLLAGAAEAEAARTMDRANANRLAIRVVFIMWILVTGGVPVWMDPLGSKHRLRKVINRRSAKPSTFLNEEILFLQAVFTEGFALDWCFNLRSGSDPQKIRGTSRGSE